MGRAPNILIVDDDNVIRTLLEKFLAGEYRISCAKDGAAALDILGSIHTEIDLILCDIEMPNLDGLQLLKVVQEKFPEIGIIMISGSANTRTAVQAIRDGAYDYITKPFHDIEEVRFTIERWRRQQSLEAKLNQYASLHREMMSNMKERTFLSIDVSGSTAIKNGEDPFIVQYSFKSYQEFIESTVLACDGVIHNTSGDGSMACFESPRNAADAARKILLDLELFNRQKNQLRKDFRLRIGMHTGNVLLNPDGKVSEMFAESLDIAGHLQKHATDNCVLASEAAVKLLTDHADFESADLTVDGLCSFRMLCPESVQLQH